MRTVAPAAAPARPLVNTAFAVFFALAVVHAPIVVIGGDAAGLFDLYLMAVIAAVLLSRMADLRFRVPASLAPLLYAYTAFLFYATLLFLTHIFMNREAFGLFSVALLLKQHQFLLIALVSGYFFSRAGSIPFHRHLYFAVLLISLYGFYRMFVTGSWYRLGLINLIGESSSNPAGFLLASSLLLLAILATDASYEWKINKALFAAVFATGYFGLFLTFSRTNNLAFILSLAAYLLGRYGGWRVLLRYVPLAASLYLGAVLLVEIFAIDIYHLLPIEYLLNPALVFSDSSFLARVQRVWLVGSEAWVANPFHLLFGTGLGTIRLTDGLLPHLLYTTGIIGTIMYYAVIVLMIVRFPLPVRAVMLLVLLNSIAVETTILSFRTMQVFVIYLTYLLYRYSREATPVVRAGAKARPTRLARPVVT